MTRKWKLASIIVAGYLLLVLLFTSLYDGVFYFTQEVKADSSVYIVDKAYQYYFHIHDNDKAIIIDFDVEKISSELAHIVVNITPKDNHKISSLFMGFENISPAEAFLYDDPSDVYVNLYDRVVNFGDSLVSITYSDMKTQKNEVIKLEYWVDLKIMTSKEQQMTMSFSIYMYEDSLLKIWRYHGQSAVQLDMNI